MKQTAVEWLINSMGCEDIVESEYPSLTKMFNEAKEMEKEQIINAQIEVLEEVNEMNANLMYIERPYKEISKEECMERWNRTVWAKTSMNKINKLKQQI